MHSICINPSQNPRPSAQSVFQCLFEPSFLTFFLSFFLLQEETATEIFEPKAVYDGRKNLFAARELQFPNGGRQHEVNDSSDSCYPST